ncbi:hypothetical protein LIER_37384 [Lithospermum erythrorhizon]|uniref:Retrotransposon Copia-like N-terminal domain-containing protein n=1 Tax=Lithospermum erythrorhizon TaxID=34254 RepID=A0AAV3PPM2_LITER
MKVALEARDKFGFVNGEIEAPSVEDVTYKEWRKVNSTLISWILNALSSEIGRGYMFIENAKDLWNELKDQFGAKSGFRRKENKSHLKYTHCGKVGHVKAGCFKLVGFLEWWGNTKGSNQVNKPRNINVNHVCYQEDVGTPLEQTDEVINFANYEEFADLVSLPYDGSQDQPALDDSTNNDDVVHDTSIVPSNSPLAPLRHQAELESLSLGLMTMLLLLCQTV